MISYYELLSSAARKAGVSLTKVAKQIGIAETTILRWRKGTTSPRYGKAQAIMREIERCGVVQRRKKSTGVAKSRPVSSR